MNLEFTRRLTIPMEVKAQYPVTAEMSRVFRDRDRQLKAILSGDDDRFLLLIGPCSADRLDSVLEYMTRLREVQEKVKEKLFLVPRCYSNKPRTNAQGYMGMLHQPDPEGRPDMLKGLIAIRELHMRVLRETGFTCADELLYTESYKYVDDLLAYVAVGARSVENQQHRLTASGIDVPVGMKNPTSGDFSVMMNAIAAAQSKHTFIYRNWEVHSQGNPYAHAVLRGYGDRQGRTHPNYHYEDLLLVSELYEKQPALQNPAIIVDTNHANSGKRYLEQIRIAGEVMRSRSLHPGVHRIVKGLMIESYLEDGAQPVGGSRCGQSITDPCLGWEKSERLIYDLAEMV